MLVYNITIKVEPEIHTSWMDWMKMEYLPELMATGFFTGHRILRIIDMDDTDGATYAVQFELKDKNDYNRYISMQSNVFRQKAWLKWGEKMLVFTTIMEAVN